MEPDLSKKLEYLKIELDCVQRNLKALIDYFNAAAREQKENEVKRNAVSFMEGYHYEKWEAIR